MPTNLKSLLSRSRSKNELKLRESKDEISPSSENSESGDSSASAVCNCESSGQHNCLNDVCCCRKSNENLCTVNVPPKSDSSSSSSHLQSRKQAENDSSSSSSSSADFSFTGSNSTYRRDASSNSTYDDDDDERCFVPETYRKSLNTDNTSSSTSTMIPPPGNSYHRPHHHHHHSHQHQQQHHHQHRSSQQHPQNGLINGPCLCCSQNNYATPSTTTYDFVPTTAASSTIAAATDYCINDSGGYYLDEKSSVPCTSSRFVNTMMDQQDKGEMRRNSSCKSLFFSCSALHQHPSCTSFESSHLDRGSEFSPTSSENHHQHHHSSSLTSGNVAGVPSSMKLPTLSRVGEGRTNMADGSVACGGSPSAACCPFNVKDGSSCQSLSMRKCETVLALSNLNGSSVSTTTTTAPLTASSGKAYHGRNSSSGAATTTAYPNFAASGTTVSHLSSSSAVSSGSSSGSNNVGGKVRGMKEKIFSTSSSALNCLFHSSSRTGKLLSGWKLSSGNSSSNSGSNTNVGHVTNMYGAGNEGNNCLNVNCQQNKHFLGSAAATTSESENKIGSSSVNSAKLSSHHHHKSRSQLSISENSFSSSPAPLTPVLPVNRLRRNVSANNTSSFCPGNGSLSAHSSYSRSSSVTSFGWKEKEDPFEQSLLCRLCLCNVPLDETMEIHACSCRYCKDCLVSYASFEIDQGADEIACPDASCEKQGVLGYHEVKHLVPPMLLEKYEKFRLFREVEKDSKLMWCPSPGCETVCQIQDNASILTGGYVTENDRAHGGGGGAVGGSRSLPFISCPTCLKTYCAECKLSWHPDSSCESFRRKLIKQGKLSTEDDELFSLDSIKKCPFCHIPIEKDSGCAQMMCKRCKHVFCWYCLASLDDDFLLRHYDKGPCKNKLGHSRASVVWHRAQVIGIFAGFGVLVLLASPLLILAAPCLLCCRCRYCANKLDPEESDLV